MNDVSQREPGTKWGGGGGVVPAGAGIPLQLGQQGARARHTRPQPGRVRLMI